MVRTSTSLLINEPPLQALPSLAKLVGINAAIILQQIHYWLQVSDHVYDAHTWVYNSYLEWAKQFPWLTPSGIRKHILDLEKSGYLISAEANRRKGDRRKWYRIDYQKLEDTIVIPVTMGVQKRQRGSESEDGLHSSNNGVEADLASGVKPQITTIDYNTETSIQDKTTKKPSLSKVPIFAELQVYLGFPEKTNKDPIPNYGKEARFIDRMRKRGYSDAEILGYWKRRIDAAGGVYVESWKINEDIGRDKTALGKQAKLLPTEDELAADAKRKGLQ